MEIPGFVFEDDYREYSPSDHRLWMELFIQSEKIDRNLTSILMYVRNTGAKLIRNSEYGYIIRPVIGQDGWTSKEEYERERQCMTPYKNEIVKLLGGLRENVQYR